MHADDLTVCAKGCEYSSIGAAVAAAEDDDRLLIEPGTYAEGEIVIDKAISLRGTADGVVVDAKDFLFAFETSAHTVTMKTFTVANTAQSRTEPAQGIINRGSLRMIQMKVSGTRGSGILNHSGATLNIKKGSVISGNGANFSGGGIRNSGDLTIWKSTISKNVLSGARGGGIVNLDGGTASIHRTVIEQNVAAYAGGYENKPGSTFTLDSESKVQDNVAPSCPQYYDPERTPSCE